MKIGSATRFISGTSPVILAIIVLCAVPELVLQGADLGLWGSTQWRILAYQNGGFWIGLLGNWRPNYPLQPYLMFATYGFLHGGLIHLIVNMMTLVSLGKIIIGRIGGWRFVLLYVLALLGGGIGFYLLSESNAPMVGASGALFGLAGAVAAWEYVDRFVARIELWPVLQLVFVLFLLNLVLWWAMNGQLAWETHLGGFVAGWIFAFIIDPRSRPIDQMDEPEA
jgi:membrane associated rhomboid family serine protease